MLLSMKITLWFVIFSFTVHICSISGISGVIYQYSKWISSYRCSVGDTKIFYLCFLWMLRCDWCNKKVDNFFSLPVHFLYVLNVQFGYKRLIHAEKRKDTYITSSCVNHTYSIYPDSRENVQHTEQVWCSSSGHCPSRYIAAYESLWKMWAWK